MVIRGSKLWPAELHEERERESGELVGTILTAFLPSFLIQSPTAIAVAVVGTVSMLQGMPTMD